MWHETIDNLIRAQPNLALLFKLIFIVRLNRKYNFIDRNIM